MNREKLKIDNKILQYLRNKKYNIFNAIHDESMEEIMERVIKAISGHAARMSHEDGKNLLCYFYRWYDGIVSGLINCAVISDNATLERWYNMADDAMTKAAIALGIAEQELKEIIRGPASPWPPAKKR